MLQLDSPNLPATADQLADLLRRSIASRSTGPSAVTVTGDLPALRQVAVDLSHTVATTDRPPLASAVGPTASGPSVDALSVVGHPVTAHGIRADLDLHATSVRFTHGTSPAGKLVVSLAAVTDGTVRFSIARDQLEAAVLTGARAAAQSAGVEIKSVQIDLRSIGPRSVDVTATFAVKKLMSAVVRVTARAAVDDQFVATLTNLQSTGEGMAGTIAAGFLKPHLQKLNGRSWPLMAASLGSVRLKDVTVTTATGLTIEARFGGD